ncbi:hypothetical protein KGQ25_02470 [Patescibacteria group bacterium]|nr:hypothetical protein [Patescibacteria group bacterium]MDE2021527.1 hypothetical protein [Patescibacteria group bacterium]MDE2173281.1 hypothetical protein [Patescibacteria group bacterium]
MIYLFHGTDVEKARAKAFEWVAKARAKEPNLTYLRLSREELTGSALEDASLSGGLFIRRLLVLIDDPFPSARTADDTEEGGGDDSASSIFEERFDVLAASDNAIVILAPKLASAKAKKLAAKAKVEYKYDKPVTRDAAHGFNTGLVNALAERSRGKLWLEINRALRTGDAPEMLHGLLHWKARNLMEKGSRAWKPQESRQLSLMLLKLLQDSRRGGLDLSLSLERFALSI